MQSEVAVLAATVHLDGLTRSGAKAALSPDLSTDFYGASALASKADRLAYSHALAAELRAASDVSWPVPIPLSQEFFVQSTGLAIRHPRAVEVLPPTLLALQEGARRWTGDLPSTADLRPFQMVGPSMEPTIPSLQWVLVDHSYRTPTDSLFLVDLGDGAHLARVQCLGPRPSQGLPPLIEVKHDNPSFNNHPYRGPASRVRFLGRVAYYLKPY